MSLGFDERDRPDCDTRAADGRFRGPLSSSLFYRRSPGGIRGFAALIWLGFIVLGGTFFIVLPPEIPASVHLPLNSIRLLGIVLLLPALAYLGWIAFRREPVRMRQWEFELPTFGLFVAQVTISAIDWIIAAGVLYILLPDSLPLTFTRFLGIFLLAQISGVASNVPGGFGIFMTRELVDELIYNETGNEVLLIKYLR